MVSVLIGTSGWVYPHWRGVFYPRELPQAKWLEFYVRTFPTVEVNNSFYRLPSADAFRSWRQRTPDGFVFTIKASRFITHIKRLREPRQPLRLLLRRAMHLEEKLGPILFQLPPRFPVDLERLEAFLRAFPCDVRCVLEFRDPSWHIPHVFDLLQRYNAAYCIMVGPTLKSEAVVTGRLLYARFHSPGRVGGPAFGRRRLRTWARRFDELLRHVDTGFIYFNNDAEGAAIEDASIFRTLLGV